MGLATTSGDQALGDSHEDIFQRGIGVVEAADLYLIGHQLIQ